MKKFLLVMCVTVMLVGLAGSASATPVYLGPTYADYGVGGTPDLTTETGYYIWSNDSDRKSWSVRWTGSNNGDTEKLDWYGSIEIGSGLNLETTTEVLFDSNHIDNMEVFNNVPFLGDIIAFEGYAGYHWDGFDFTIEGEVGSVIGFNLGSSAWSLGQPSINENNVATGIFIGQDNNKPNVMYQNILNSDDEILGVGQNFEIPAPVPEPASLALLGIGLLSLAGIGRKKYAKK